MTQITTAWPVRPVVDLDFANSAVIPPGVTCNRPTIATYVDKVGYIRKAQMNTPRLEWGGDGKCLGLLVEGNGTNALPHSETHTEAGWTTVASTLAGVGKYGDMTYTQVKDTTADSIHTLRCNLVGLSPEVYYSTRQHFQWNIADPKSARFVSCTNVPKADGVGGIGDIWSTCHVDLKTGEFKVVNSATAPANMTRWKVMRYNSGLVIVMQATKCPDNTGASGNPYLDIRLSNATSLAQLTSSGMRYVGTGMYLHVGGVQLESRSQLCTSYVPTDSAPVMRGADRIMYNGITIPANWTAVTTCSRYFNVIPAQPDMTPYSITSNNQQRSFRLNWSINMLITPEVGRPGSSTSAVAYSFPYTTTEDQWTTAFSYAEPGTLDGVASWSTNSKPSHQFPQALYINGIDGTLHLGYSMSNSMYWHGHIQRFTLFPQATSREQTEILSELKPIGK